MQKTDFHVLELFCRASHVRASMHRITSLELLRTLMLCLVQLSKWRESKAKDAEKLLSQWEKVAKCNFKSKAQVHERYLLLMKWNVICNAEDRFSCLELFLRAKNTNAVRAKNTNAVFSATKQWRECKATDAEKLLSQWEKVANKLFCRASHVRVSMHRITGLELLRTLMLCLVQLSKWRESKATDAENLLSLRKLLNAILRVTLKYMKDISSHEMKCYLQCRRQIFMFRAFFKS